MRPVRTIGQILPSPRDPHNPEEKSCVVYQVPCSDCNFVYIGQTKRDLKSRLAEHKLTIKNQEPEKSALCEHYMRFDHLIDWNNSKILKTEAHYSKRLTSEAWFICIMLFTKAVLGALKNRVLSEKLKSLVDKTFSKVFDKAGKIEIGRKFQERY